jgi:D-amino peptidase
MRMRAIAVLLVLAACSPAAAPVAEKTAAAPPSEPWTLEAVTPDTTDGIRVLIIHDMEGLSGQDNPKTYFFGEKEYAQGQEMLVGDINAVIEGLYAGGATEVWVVDGHGSGNPGPDVRRDLLDQRAQQILRDSTFDAYVDLVVPKAFDAVAAVGMHAKTGSKGFAAHTFTLGIGLKVNGNYITESELVGLSWGRQGIPLIFVSGDDRLAADLAHLEWLQFVTVKKATAADSAEPRPVAEARADLTSNAKLAVENLKGGKAKAMKVNTPITAALRAVYPADLSMLDGVPGVDYADSTVTFQADSMAAMYKTWITLVGVATSGYNRIFQRTVAASGNPAVMKQFGDNLKQAWFDYESGRFVPPPPRTPPADRKYHGFQ